MLEQPLQAQDLLAGNCSCKRDPQDFPMSTPTPGNLLAASPLAPLLCTTVPVGAGAREQRTEPALFPLREPLGTRRGTWCFLEQVVSAAMHLPGVPGSAGRARGVLPSHGAAHPASPQWAAG